MDNLEKLLAKSFEEIQGFVPTNGRYTTPKEKLYEPYFEVQDARTMNSLDFCQTEEEVDKSAARSNWQEWNLWKIQGGVRILIGYFSQRELNNETKLGAFLGDKPSE